jgi:hypothetical protein
MDCVDRIYTYLMARAFQQMNLEHGIHVDAQKGFIKKTNGSSEHGILLNEMFQAANREKQDLIVTAIDFSNAFGSVPHDLITSMLKQWNFLTWVRRILKDTHDNAKSKTEYKGRQTDSIMWRKGVK